MNIDLLYIYDMTNEHIGSSIDDGNRHVRHGSRYIYIREAIKIK